MREGEERRIKGEGSGIAIRHARRACRLIPYAGIGVALPHFTRIRFYGTGASHSVTVAAARICAISAGFTGTPSSELAV